MEGEFESESEFEDEGFLGLADSDDQRVTSTGTLSPDNVPFEVLRECWERFEQALIACGPPSQEVLLECMGPRPSLGRAQRCGNIADRVRASCHRQALAEYQL